jgi:hypothetical protein
MEQDESGTFNRLRACRKDFFEPCISEHNGHIFKLMGDGVIAEFGSAVEAVECAVALQRGMFERNRTAPENHRIEFRIAVNLGDLIIEGQESGEIDLHGDGVIIANRLQALAKPGEVLISGVVYDQLRRKIEAGFQFLGEQHVKNIAEPVRVYRVLSDAPVGSTIGLRRLRASQFWPLGVGMLLSALAAGTIVWLQPWKQRIEPASTARMALPLPDRPSIAVLPFANMSEDPSRPRFPVYS